MADVREAAPLGPPRKKYMGRPHPEVRTTRSHTRSRRGSVTISINVHHWLHGLRGPLMGIVGLVLLMDWYTVGVGLRRC